MKAFSCARAAPVSGGVAPGPPERARWVRGLRAACRRMRALEARGRTIWLAGYHPHRRRRRHPPFLVTRKKNA